MPKVSRSEADSNRLRVTKTASKMFRERGIERVSVAEVMEGAGMTVGAFHAQFGSKDALATEACAHGFAEVDLSWRHRIHEDGAGHEVAMQLLRSYLSDEHRDNPGLGCAATALASDVAHQDTNVGLREAYLTGIHHFSETLSTLLSPSVPKKERRQRALALYATIVGAVTIARATSTDPVSSEILDAALLAIKESGSI